MAQSAPSTSTTNSYLLRALADPAKEVGLQAWPKARYDNDSWRHSAACAQEDSDLFFPVGTAVEPIERAKAVCAVCPVRQACLAFALTTNQEFGVWGGCDEDQRRALRRQWRTAARDQHKSA